MRRGSITGISEGVTASLVTLGDERLVSLRTYRPTGEPVEAPVWVVRDGDALVAYTTRASGKVTRIRQGSEVELRACDRRGRVEPGTPSVTATAEVDESPEAIQRTERLLRIKYGWQFAGLRLMRAAERILGRSHALQPRAVLRITPM